jgi:hypothetical protein
MGAFIFNYMIKAKKENDDPNFYSQNIISYYFYVIQTLILYSKNSQPFCIIRLYNINLILKKTTCLNFLYYKTHWKYWQARCKL